MKQHKKITDMGIMILVYMCFLIGCSNEKNIQEKEAPLITGEAITCIYSIPEGVAFKDNDSMFCLEDGKDIIRMTIDYSYDGEKEPSGYLKKNSGVELIDSNELKSDFTGTKVYRCNVSENGKDNTYHIVFFSDYSWVYVYELLEEEYADVEEYIAKTTRIEKVN